VLSGNKTSSVLTTWDGSISIPLPPDTKFPAVVTFGISNVAPEPEAGIGAFFPDIDVRGDGEVVEYDDEDTPSVEIVRDDGGIFQDDEVRAPEEKPVPTETGLELGKVKRSQTTKPSK